MSSCDLVAAQNLDNVRSYSLNIFYSSKECYRSELTEADEEHAMEFKFKTMSVQWLQQGSLHEQMQEAPIN